MANGEKDGVPKIIEPAVLTPKRTEFGKQIRKQYEKGEIQMSKEINICYDKTRVSKQSNQTNPCAILQVLWEIIGEKKVHWAAGRLAVVFKEEILRQGLHAQSIREEGGQTAIQTCSSLIKQDSIPLTSERKEMRDMRFNTEHRCASQGFQLSEQFYREFDDFVSELSYENPQAKECLSNLRSTCEGPQSLQQTFSALEEVRRSLTHTLEHIHTPQYRIRKLTPREVFRLMDVDDADIDKIQAAGISNSQQYKMAGNSIVVSCLYHLFRKMFVETQNEEQQLTFF